MKELIGICVCTRRRVELLESLIKSILNLEISNQIEVELIIIENDTVSSIKKLLSIYQDHIDLNHFIEPNIGIVNARNRALYESKHCDYTIFIDDDQKVSYNWLREMIMCHKEFNADVVYNYAPPSFNKIVSPYVEKFYTPGVYKNGSPLRIAGTNGLSLRRATIDSEILVFSSKFNLSGGEDIFLIKSLIKNNYKVCSATNAVSYEIIQNSRTCLRYLIKRKFSHGNVNAIIFMSKGANENFVSFSKVLISMFLKSLINIPCLFFNKAKKYDTLFYWSFLLGVFSGLVGFNQRLYKKIDK